jgi:hypothetical protein
MRAHRSLRAGLLALSLLAPGAASAQAPAAALRRDGQHDFDFLLV